MKEIFLQRVAVGTSLFLPISSLFSGRNAMGASEPGQALSADYCHFKTILCLLHAYLLSEMPRRSAAET